MARPITAVKFNDGTYKTNNTKNSNLTNQKNITLFKSESREATTQSRLDKLNEIREKTKSRLDKLNEMREKTKTNIQTTPKQQKPEENIANSGINIFC